MPADEKVLLEKARSGDREALGDLLVLHERSCFSLALRLAGNSADAEDACQEAFSRAARDLAGWKPVGSFRSWLLTIVVCAHRNRLDSERARRRREGGYAMEKQAVVVESRSRVEREELRRQLDASLAQLEENYRLPIVLTYEQGLSHAEAAAVLSMPEGTVKTNVRRGLEELRGLLARAGYAGAALSVVEGALAQAPAVSVPASLTAFIRGLALPKGAKAAAAGSSVAATKGGILMKIGLGILAAGALAGGIAAVGSGFRVQGFGLSNQPGTGNRELGTAPTAAPEKKPKFNIPIWHPDARWELCRLGACNASGFLDGPTREMQSSSLGVFGPGYTNAEGGRFFFGWFDPESGLAYAAAGSGRGYLDGPISRARFTGWDYNGGPFIVDSADSRYLFVTDSLGGKRTLRRIDWEKQMVSTIVRDLPAFLGMTGGPGGTIYVLGANGQIQVLNADGKQEKEYKVDMTNAVTSGFLRNYPLAVDDVHSRLYCAAPPSKGWYLGYWDLKDGSYHGVVPKSEKRRNRNQPGPFEGVDWYDEGNIIQFGPDDPERRFLYMVRTDTWQGFRLDLEKKMVAALLYEGGGRTGKPLIVSFSETQATGTAMIYGTMRWLTDGSGSFTAITHSPSEAWLYMRVK